MFFGVYSLCDNDHSLNTYSVPGRDFGKHGQTWPLTSQVLTRYRILVALRGQKPEAQSGIDVLKIMSCQTAEAGVNLARTVS